MGVDTRTSGAVGPPGRLRPRVLLPALLVVLLAFIGPFLTHRVDACDSTDGPQFKCWLQGE